MPITEAWSLHKIINDIHRSGVTMDKSAVQGSLAVMTRAGLVTEVEHNTFQRAPIRPLRARAAQIKQQETKIGTAMQEAMTRASTDTTGKTPALTAAGQKASTLDALAQVAADLRAQSKDLEAEADRLEEIALQIASDQQAGSKEMAEIQRMRSALKTLMGEG